MGGAMPPLFRVFQESSKQRRYYIMKKLAIVLLFATSSAYSATAILTPILVDSETPKEKFYRLMTYKTSYKVINGGIKLPSNYTSADTLIKNEDGTVELINMSNNLKPTL